MATVEAAQAPGRVPGLGTIVGFLVCVEIASGILQGYYTPIFSDIARHLDIHDADVNWFEAAQLVVSALVVPVLARLGDLVGHRNVLLLSTAVTAVASWGVAFAPSFGTFLVAWAIQGFYVVWLPLEVSIIHRRTADTGAQTRLTRRAASFLVAALELGVILGAATSGALVTSLRMTLLLTVPAIAVTICLVIVWFGVAPTPPVHTGRLDVRGFLLVTLAIGLVMAGLILVRIQGPGAALPWVVIVLGRPGVLALRALRAQPRGAADRRTAAGDGAPVAGAADRVPVRDVGARGADPALDLRAHRPGGDRLRARRQRGVRDRPDRRLRARPRGRGAAAAAGRSAGRHPLRDAHRRRCWWRWATACSSRSTPRRRRPW